MFIKSLYNPREYDVFLGEGWENWVRVRIGNNNKIQVLKTNIEELEPSTVRLIMFKINKQRRKEAAPAPV